MKKLDRTKRLRYRTGNLADRRMTREGRETMRKMMALLMALGLMLTVAGTALAECGSGHTDTAQPTPTKPPPQS